MGATEKRIPGSSKLMAAPYSIGPEKWNPLFGGIRCDNNGISPLSRPMGRDNGDLCIRPGFARPSRRPHFLARATICVGLTKRSAMISQISVVIM